MIPSIANFRTPPASSAAQAAAQPPSRAQNLQQSFLEALWDAGAGVTAATTNNATQLPEFMSTRAKSSNSDLSLFADAPRREEPEPVKDRNREDTPVAASPLAPHPEGILTRHGSGGNGGGHANEDNPASAAHSDAGAANGSESASATEDDTPSQPSATGEHETAFDATVKPTEVPQEPTGDRVEFSARALEMEVEAVAAESGAALQNQAGGTATGSGGQQEMWKAATAAIEDESPSVKTSSQGVAEVTGKNIAPQATKEKVAQPPASAQATTENTKAELEAGVIGKPGNSTLRSLELNLKGEGTQSVRIHMSQSGDDLQVRVQARDARVTDQLRENVSHLMTTLQDQGLEADIRTRPEPAQESFAGQQQSRQNPRQQQQDADETPQSRQSASVRTPKEKSHGFRSR